MRGAWKLTAFAVVLVACEPDDFRYTGQPSGDACRQDPCGDAAPESCGDVWVASVEDVTPRAIVVDPDSIYVAGDLESDGRPPVAWLGKRDRCLGLMRGEHPLITYDSSVGGAVRMSNGIVIAGSSKAEKIPTTAFVNELEPVALASSWLEILPGSGGGDALHAAARSGDSIWAVGETGLDASPRAFGVKIAPGRPACSFAFGDTPTVLTAVAVDGANVYAIGRDAIGISLFRFDDLACDVTACNCQPAHARTGILPAGAPQAEPRNAVAHDGTIYVSGIVRSGTSRSGFVLALQGDTGDITGSIVFDPSANNDEIDALASDGQTLYVGGVRGASDAIGMERGIAVLGAFPLPLVPNAAPSWQIDLAQGEVVTALAVEPDGSFVYAGVERADKPTVLVRCQPSGFCPAFD